MMVDPRPEEGLERERERYGGVGARESRVTGVIIM